MSVHKSMSSRAALHAFVQRSVLLGALLAPLSTVEAADPLPQPQGAVILTVTGAIARTNGPDGAQFDRQMLLDLGETQISTTTPWTDGIQEFSGVLARDVLKHVGAEGDTVLATALNDYTVRVPMADFLNNDVLLAMEMNGEEMQISDKGPIWIIYPRDDVPALQNTLLHERWVWQLRELQVQ
ncbi:molybdopterin-dependent oxidoreductase [Devosia sediminis]|uniref:Molybdopterin-dependent oxidoreductase n=1 Tax=Devosia sediminis TaxID=2798801 RepID=A0A934IRX8_9HYPH|nr:molybdopterin-dependent oxidoreductase [Devosia sediminis]MBJ3783172.1 molybdopterin-dependent oxidoreductase [Devosia sediminis]